MEAALEKAPASDLEEVRGKKKHFPASCCGYIAFLPLNKTREDLLEEDKERRENEKGRNNLRPGRQAQGARPHVSTCTCETCRRNRRPGERPSKHLGYCLGGASESSPLLVGILEGSGLKRMPQSGRWSVHWSSTHMRAYDYRKLHRYQRVNCFPCSFEVTRKDALCRNIKRLRQVHGSRLFSFMPETFTIPKERAELSEEMDALGGLWIVKPSGSACGRGIRIVNSVADVPSYVGAKDSFVVQKYVDRPLLISGRKFDLRLYVCVTSFHPLTIYLHEEGLCRFASEPYTSSQASIENVFVHLTNYSVNKHFKGPSEGASDGKDGDSSCSLLPSKISLSELRMQLEILGADVSAVWSAIEDVIIKTLISVEMPISRATEKFAQRGQCFQLFGFDILLDYKCDPHLMEVGPSICVHPAMHHARTCSIALPACSQSTGQFRSVTGH
jgi:hypothetical protein